jgi:hypothetical protein
MMKVWSFLSQDLAISVYNAATLNQDCQNVYLKSHRPWSLCSQDTGRQMTHMQFTATIVQV